ncbi:hypothetical protein PtA15_3A325 [Puccinia triticina]|uniref:SANT domain-containing protein n=1 Tax=Puccinia triticina TaxID=208348 RepID=A0ABY7CE33_9BASI|nr:uncharacterized protein PtA15_3A325 [Puccinia triticina]WAQ82959.1 hypothetical protein PtA15_3A325 [Puccinia triticina]WAR53786.1 hypothetical protein PtB15_3B295 [Puccinia triticina]
MTQAQEDHHQSTAHGDQENLDGLAQNLRAVYRSYHLDWIEHCEAIDRLRLRLTRKKRPTLTPVTTTVDIAAGIPACESAANVLNPAPIGALSSGSAGITGSLTATGRTTRRTANLSSFGDAVTDAQFDLVLAQLGTADQKDPNIRAMKTTATVPDMALLPSHRLQLSVSEDQTSDTLVSDPIAFYELNPPDSEPPPSGYQEPSIWTAQEQEAFEKSYTAQPKQFGWIASQVKTKNRAQCVIHYYRTKRENKYRNLHLPPQPILEGKSRELRGKRTRRVPCKTPTTADPLTPSSLKPKPTKSTSDAIPPTGDEPDDESVYHQANETDLSSTATASILVSSSTHRDLPTPTFSAPSPAQSSMVDPSERTSIVSGDHRARLELADPSTESNRSNTPKPTPTKPLDLLNPVASTSLPAKSAEDPTPKWPARAYKKRKVHAIDTSNSRPVPSAHSSSVVDLAPPSKPDAQTSHTLNPPSGSAYSSEPLPSAHPNGSDASSAQINGLPVSRQTPGLEATPSLMEVDEPPAGRSSQPKIPEAAPVIRSSMQIKNLLNDDPVELSATMSSMDASAWFGNDSTEATPTEEIPEPGPTKPPLKLPPVDRALLPPPRGDYYQSSTTLPRPLSQPLSQPSFPPLPRPLSRPLSRLSSHASHAQQQSSASLPPSHRLTASDSSSAHPPPAATDHLPGRQFDGMLVDERFADPPSSPGSPSVGGGPANRISSRGLPEPDPSSSKPMSVAGRSALSYQIKYERGFPGPDRPHFPEHYPPPQPPTSGPSISTLSSIVQPPLPPPPSASSQSPRPPSLHHFPTPTHSTSPRPGHPHGSGSLLRSPSSARGPLPPPGPYPAHSPGVGTRFSNNRLPPIPASLSSSHHHRLNHHLPPPEPPPPISASSWHNTPPPPGNHLSPFDGSPAAAADRKQWEQQQHNQQWEQGYLQQQKQQQYHEQRDREQREREQLHHSKQLPHHHHLIHPFPSSSSSPATTAPKDHHHQQYIHHHPSSSASHHHLHGLHERRPPVDIEPPEPAPPPPAAPGSATANGGPPGSSSSAAKSSGMGARNTGDRWADRL